MDPLVIVLTIVASVLSLVLVAVSIQAILVLQELKKTLRRVNSLSDTVEKIVIQTVSPLHNLGSMMSGMKSGLKLFEAFAAFLKKHIEKDAKES